MRAESYPDGKRVRVSLELTPFQQQPYIELTRMNPDGNKISSTSIIEPVSWKMELILHIHSLSEAEGHTSQVAHDASHSTRGTLILAALQSYPDLGETDQREVNVQIQPVAD